MKPFSLLTKDHLSLTLTARFEEVVAALPNNIAVKSGRGEFSYREINNRANRIGENILTLVKPGNRPVGVLVTKGEDSISTIFGALKAGKIFFALNAALPHKHLVEIVRQSEIELLAADNPHLALAEKISGETRIPLLNISDLDFQGDQPNLEIPANMEDLTVILSTSGSTGKSKGVIHDHRSLMHVSITRTAMFQTQPSDSLLNMADHYFVNGITAPLEILLNGGRVHPYVMREMGLRNMADLLIDEKITIVHPMPTIFRQMLHTLKPNEKFPDLRVVFFGGEPLRPEDIHLTRKLISESGVIYNSLGSSEAPTISTNVIGKNIRIPDGLVSTGTPRPEKEVIIVDDNRSPVGVDQLGEIVVKSSYLARGYWNNPTLTQEKFVPVDDQAGNVLYYSGDLGVLKEDESLDYYGRIDSEIKLLGAKVSVSGVENELVKHRNVRESAVKKFTDQDLNEYLVGYLVPMEKPGPTPAEIRSYLREILPQNEIPQIYVTLDSIPITGTGKTNYLELPAPDFQRPAMSLPYLPPRTRLEESLHDIWQEFVPLSPLGIDDEFFDLGGDSLQAAEMVGHVNRELGVDLSPESLLETGTIAEMAEFIEKEGSSPFSTLVPIQPDGKLPPLYLVHGIGGNVLVFKDLGRAVGPQRPVYGLQAYSQWAFDRLPSSIPEVAEHYVREILAVHGSGPIHLGGYSFGCLIAFEMANQLIHQGVEIGTLAMLDAPATIRGTLWHPWQITFGQIKSHYQQGGLGAVYRRFLRRTSLSDKMDRIEKNRVALRTVFTRIRKEYIPNTFVGNVDFFQILSREKIPWKGWRQHIQGEINIHPVPGYHHTILEPPNVTALAEKIEIALNAKTP